MGILVKILEDARSIGEGSIVLGLDGLLIGEGSRGGMWTEWAFDESNSICC
jgi:hypothetical protein